MSILTDAEDISLVYDARGQALCNLASNKNGKCIRVADKYELTRTVDGFQ